MCNMSSGVTHVIKCVVSAKSEHVLHLRLLLVTVGASRFSMPFGGQAVTAVLHIKIPHLRSRVLSYRHQI